MYQSGERVEGYLNKRKHKRVLKERFAKREGYDGYDELCAERGKGNKYWKCASHSVKRESQEDNGKKKKIFKNVSQSSTWEGEWE